jgi:ABC-type phosphate/phosphonate transport system substrate-binding protein
LYRTDLVVRTDSRDQRLSDTFGGRIGWSRRDSHSGFNALRHHPLQYRTPERPSLYSEVIGNLGALRTTLDSVLDGAIDVGPLDAYWLAVMQHHHPALAVGVRVLESTATAPIPAFVASPSVPQEVVDRLVVDVRSARDQPWFRAIAEVLLLDGFPPVRELSTFDVLRARARQAEEAGYPSPA